MQAYRHGSSLVAGRWQRRAAAGLRATPHHGPRGCCSRASVKDFIANECPIAGFDGRYRERARDSDVEAAMLSLDLHGVMTPGCQALLRVSEQTLEQVVQDQGQVLLCVTQPPTPGSGLSPLQPPKGGSYSCIGQSYGLQRLPGGQGGYMRVVVQQRVLVQAIREDAKSGNRAQAAVLQDRWAYYVRAQVVEQVLEAAIAAAGGSYCSQETLDLKGQPADVRTAVTSMQDVAQQLMAEVAEMLQTQAPLLPLPSPPTLTLRPTPRTLPLTLNTQDVAQQLMAEVAEMRELLRTQAKRLQLQQGQGENPSSGGGANGPASDQLDEVHDELARVLEFVHGPDGDAMAKGSDVLAFGALQRLSYALLAAEQLTSYAGLSQSELLKQRRKALEATDLGLRLEAALDLAGEISSRLAARSALTV